MNKIAVFTGKFKPPHKGHNEVIKQALLDNDELVVFVSGKPEDGITAETAIKILNLYVGESDRVTIKKASGSPVKAAYDYIHDLGKSTKAKDYSISLYATPEDMDRFDKIEDYVGEIASIERIETPRIEVSGKPLYARDIRKFIKNDDFESFKSAIPSEVQPERVWKVLKEGIKMTVPADSFDIKKKRNPQIDPNVVPTQKMVQHPTYRDGYMNENYIVRFEEFTKNRPY